MACVTWASESFAQRQQAVGPGTIPLNAAGSLNGVDMSASATTGTLTVGVMGGPQTDVFSSNASLASPLTAISTAASSQGNIVFNSGSNVFGAIGVTQPGGPFLLNLSGGNAGAVVNFMGPVFATITTVSGTGTINFNSGSTNISALIFAADGTIGLAPNTTVIGALTTTAGANPGTLNLRQQHPQWRRRRRDRPQEHRCHRRQQYRRRDRDHRRRDPGGFVHPWNEYVEYRRCPDAQRRWDHQYDPGEHGGFRQHQTGRSDKSSSVAFGQRDVTSSAIIPVGNIFNIVQTRTGTVQSGTNGSIVNVSVQNPTNPLYTFSAVPVGGTVAGLVAIRVTGVPAQVPLAPPPGAPPITPVAAAVVPALLTTTLPVLGSINALSNPIDVINAVAQLAPSVAALSAPYVTFEVSRQFQNLWLSRLDETTCGQARRQRKPGEEVAP